MLRRHLPGGAAMETYAPGCVKTDAGRFVKLNNRALVRLLIVAARVQVMRHSSPGVTPNRFTFFRIYGVCSMPNPRVCGRRATAVTIVVCWSSKRGQRGGGGA
jgi:hypothetical protein